MVWSVGLRSYLEVVSVAKSIRRVVLQARKYNIHLTICFYYVSLRTRILGQKPRSSIESQITKQKVGIGHRRMKLLQSIWMYFCCQNDSFRHLVVNHSMSEPCSIKIPLQPFQTSAFSRVTDPYGERFLNKLFFSASLTILSAVE
jgi:hypothetical protein